MDQSSVGICVLHDRFQRQIRGALVNYIEEDTVWTRNYAFPMDLKSQGARQKAIDDYVDRRGLEHYPNTSNYK